MSPIQTFWLESTERVRLGLRRYVRRNQFPGWTCERGWHDAMAWLDTELDAHRDSAGYIVSPPGPPEGRRHPAWPRTCSRCDYAFTSQDYWQPWQELLYRRADNGELRVLHPTLHPPDVPPAEPGAMWHSNWAPGAKPVDGICLTVRCPRPDDSPGAPNDWCVDAASRSGGRWTRTGDPRLANVSATPSIAIGDQGKPGFYHGYLTDGVLTDHLGG